MRLSIVATLVRAFIAWLMILGLATANGVLRESVLVPALGTTPGLMLSGADSCAHTPDRASVVLGRSVDLCGRRILDIGAFWLALTLAFEFGFGRAVAHKTWTQLLDAYTFRDGNLWPLVLLVVVLAPLFAAWLRRRCPA